MPRSNRKSSGGGIDLRKSRTIADKSEGGNFGIEVGTQWPQREERRTPFQRLFGLKDDFTASAGINLKNLLKQRISGGINLSERSGNIDIELGSQKKGYGIKLGGELRLGDNGLPVSFKIDIGGSIAKLGGSISADSDGKRSLKLEAGIASIALARGSDGEFAFTRCVELGGLAEACIITSRHGKDPQPISTRPVIPGKQSPLRRKRPIKPIAKVAPRRKKPVQKNPIKPKPKPIKPTPIPKPKPKRPPTPKPIKPVPTPKPIPTPSPAKPKRPAPTPTPAPIPKPKRPGPKPIDCDDFFTQSNLPILPSGPNYSASILFLGDRGIFKNCVGYGSGSGSQGFMFESSSSEPADAALSNARPHPWRDYLEYDIQSIPASIGAVEVRQLGYSRSVIKGDLIKGAGPWYKDDAPAIGSDITMEGGYYYSSYWTRIDGTAATIAGAIANLLRAYSSYPRHKIYISSQPRSWAPHTPVRPSCSPPPRSTLPRLPNQPQKIKPMKDCCDLMREVHKHLGIKKLKENKFSVAKAFLVAGGEGNEKCEDYYEITQQLFRMLANGLIINPKSKPLGNEWQSVNATAWAGNMYEMMAEAMSNGNSSQKYEIASIVQLTQLLTILAETSRKVEYLIDRLGGGDPIIEVEEIPAVFTVYEGHKGFEKKSAKKIDITKARTDDDV